MASAAARRSRTDAAQHAAEYIRPRLSERPEIGVILGSGLGGFADNLSAPTIISAADIPGYPTSSVPGHAGHLVFGRLEDAGRRSPALMIFKGRVHYYETGDIDTVVLPIRIARELGVRTLIVTNAAGGINSQFSGGDLMVIRDIIEFGFRRARIQRPTRPEATRRPPGIDDGLADLILTCAHNAGIRVQQGVYCWVQGPSYETAAEIQMLKRLGADAVGMSTVPEILLANELGMRTAGVSLISNLATGIASAPLSHQEVTETADRTKMVFTRLMTEVLLHLPARHGRG